MSKRTLRVVRYTTPLASARPQNSIVQVRWKRFVHNIETEPDFTKNEAVTAIVTMIQDLYIETVLFNYKKLKQTT